MLCVLCESVISIWNGDTILFKYSNVINIEKSLKICPTEECWFFKHILVCKGECYLGVPCSDKSLGLIVQHQDGVKNKLYQEKEKRLVRPGSARGGVSTASHPLRPSHGEACPRRGTAVPTFQPKEPCPPCGSPSIKVMSSHVSEGIHKLLDASQSRFGVPTFNKSGLGI